MGCYNSTLVDAPIDRVWGALRDFHDMSWAPNVIQDLQPQGDPEKVGAKRVLNGVFFETLISFDDQARTLRYSIDNGPETVSSDNVIAYIGEIRAFPVTDAGQTFVLWASSWESSGGGVAEFCNPIYQALLGDLKRQFAAD